MVHLISLFFFPLWVLVYSGKVGIGVLYTFLGFLLCAILAVPPYHGTSISLFFCPGKRRNITYSQTFVMVLSFQSIIVQSHEIFSQTSFSCWCLGNLMLWYHIEISGMHPFCCVHAVQDLKLGTASPLAVLILLLWTHNTCNYSNHNYIIITI